MKLQPYVQENDEVNKEQTERKQIKHEQMKET